MHRGTLPLSHAITPTGATAMVMPQMTNHSLLSIGQLCVMIALLSSQSMLY